MQITVNLVIIIITVITSLAAFNNQKLVNDLIFYPPAITHDRQWYRFFSCGLIHADTAHLIFNMLGLYMFGQEVEQTFTLIFGDNGKWLYLLMYVSALFASLIPTYAKHKNDSYYRSLGASGAVSAVVFIFVMTDPTRKLGFFIIPPVIPGFIFGPLYLIISSYLDRKGKDNINHSAHIFGALYGIGFLIIAGNFVGYNAIREFTEVVGAYLRGAGR